jgi:hypothetical protein
MMTRSCRSVWTKGNGELDIVNINRGIYMEIAVVDHVAAVEMMKLIIDEGITNSRLCVVLCYAATDQSRLELSKLTYDRLLTKNDNKFFLGLPWGSSIVFHRGASPLRRRPPRPSRSRGFWYHCSESTDGAIDDAATDCASLLSRTVSRDSVLATDPSYKVGSPGLAGFSRSEEGVDTAGGGGGGGGMAFTELFIRRLKFRIGRRGV